MKIAFLPFTNQENRYIDISKSILEEFNNQIYDFKQLNIKSLKKMNMVFFNWFEALNSKYLGIAELRFIKKLMILRILRKYNIKIVVVFHNRLSHDVHGLTKVETKYLLKCILEFADRVIILSKDSVRYLGEYITSEKIKEKSMYIPHPNYIGVYSEAVESAPKLTEHMSMKILFIGAVKKYKNIELIIEIARRTQDLKIEYTIAGKCINEKYRKEIEFAVVDLNNMHLNLQFIEDSKLEQLIRQHDIMILPYDITSSMNSGTVFLAFSNGRSVICPLISSIKEFNREFTYSYIYKSKAEHLIRLEQSVREAYNDYMYNRDIFEDKGKYLFNEVKKKNSQEVLREKYKELLEGIGGRSLRGI